MERVRTESRSGFDSIQRPASRSLSFRRSRLGLLFVLLFAAACDQAELYHKLTEREANEFIVKLAAGNVEAVKEAEHVERGDQTYLIKVPKDKLALSFQILETYGLPKNQGLGIEHVYPGGGLIPGMFEEKAKYLLALTGEIEKTLRSIEGVIDARVHVVMPEESVLKDEDEGIVKPTASVLIRYVPGADAKKPIEDADVQQLVAKSVEGLSFNDVKVVALPVKTPVASAATTTDASGAVVGKMTAEQCLTEYKDTIVDKALLVKVGPLAVHKDSHKYFLAVVGTLGGVALVFFVLWLVAFLQASGLRKKLAAVQKGKAKKPTSNE